MRSLPILLTVLLLAGCSTIRGGSGSFKIDAPRDKPELYGAYNDAVDLLGMEHKGGTVRVRFAAGHTMSNARPWMGRTNPQFEGVALGVWVPSRKSILLYTTNGRWRYETARWEFGRAIMDSRGIRTREKQERKMLEKGFR